MGLEIKPGSGAIVALYGIGGRINGADFLADYNAELTIGGRVEVKDRGGGVGEEVVAEQEEVCWRHGAGSRVAGHRDRVGNTREQTHDVGVAGGDAGGI